MDFGNNDIAVHIQFGNYPVIGLSGYILISGCKNCPFCIKSGTAFCEAGRRFSDLSYRWHLNLANSVLFNLFPEK